MTKLNKLLIGILVVIMFGCISFTAYMITREPAKMEPINEKADYGDIITGSREDKKVKDDAKGFTSFIDPIVRNPIIFSSPEYGVDGLISISGLKDKTIEKQINSEINKDKIKSGISYLESNNSNIISIVHRNDRSVIEKFSNFRLDTGERLEFEDIFTSNANIIQILTSIIYRGLVWNSCDKFFSDSYGAPATFRRCEEKDTAKIDYVAIEEESFRLINYYKINGIKDFGIDRGYIYFKIDKTWFKMYIGDFYTEVALYNRFKDKTNIYDKPIDNEKYDTVFGRAFDFYIHEKITDNFYVMSSLEPVNSKIKSNMDSVIAKVKNMANKNSNKAYYLEFGSSHGDDTEDDFHVDLFEIDRSYFDKNIEKSTIESFRTTAVWDIFKTHYYWPNFNRIELQ